MRTIKLWQRGLVVLGVMAICCPAWGQLRPRIPQSGTNTNASYQAPGATGSYGAGGSAGLVPVTPAPTAPSGNAILGQPSFDPYSTAPSATPPAYYGGPAASPYGGGAGAPLLPPPSLGAPAAGAYGGVAPGAYGMPPGSCPPGYPSATPPVLFPNGVGGPDSVFGAPQYGGTMKLVQGVHLEHTYVYGTDHPRELEINDSVVAVPLAFPNFFYTGQPVVVTPTFALHLWDGPNPPNRADLPGQAYSAFVDTSWTSDPNARFGAELATRVGVFTDFDTFNTDSLRVQGIALARTRLTPTVTLKVGAIYIDRVDLKLLPAGGIFWYPNPQTRFDIFFPEPKLAQYLTTLGTYDIWWYVAAEYGGGSWTIERADGSSDRVDINDIRVVLGLEWGPNYLIRQDHRVGFIEAGWVTDREIVYAIRPEDNITLRDSAMVRVGFNF